MGQWLGPGTDSGPPGPAEAVAGQQLWPAKWNTSLGQAHSRRYGSEKAIGLASQDTVTMDRA